MNQFQQRLEKRITRGLCKLLGRGKSGSEAAIKKRLLLQADQNKGARRM